MRIIVLSNDVIPGFGVPVAAPGLRAAGLAKGLRANGHDVTVFVPEDLLAQLFGASVQEAPTGAKVVSPLAFMDEIDRHGASAVVFINSNLTPHLHQRPDVRYIYDLFAPKVLELEASTGTLQEELDAAIAHVTQVKARALALADAVWVNGARKVDYARSWLDRGEVAQHRAELGRTAAKPATVTVVEMPVPLPPSVTVGSSSASRSTDARRLGIAGYAQKWSSLDSVHPGHQLLVDAGHELHALLPGHWGGNPTSVPICALPDATINHHGPLQFDEFAAWIQSMDAMVDVFAPSPERRFAMITRSAVALRLGVPLIHAVDSEVADIVRSHNAGWVLDPTDLDAWHAVIADLADPDCVAAKTAGAIEASHTRFAPEAALRNASATLA